MENCQSLKRGNYDLDGSVTSPGCLANSCNGCLKLLIGARGEGGNEAGSFAEDNSNLTNLLN